MSKLVNADGQPESGSQNVADRRFPRSSKEALTNEPGRHGARCVCSQNQLVLSSRARYCPAPVAPLSRSPRTVDECPAYRDC